MWFHVVVDKFRKTSAPHIFASYQQLSATPGRHGIIFQGMKSPIKYAARKYAYLDTYLNLGFSWFLKPQHYFWRRRLLIKAGDHVVHVHSSNDCRIFTQATHRLQNRFKKNIIFCLTAAPYAPYHLYPLLSRFRQVMMSFFPSSHAYNILVTLSLHAKSHRKSL